MIPLKFHSLPLLWGLRIGENKIVARGRDIEAVSRSLETSCACQSPDTFAVDAP